MNLPSSSKFYSGYEKWKHWDKPFNFNADEAKYFVGETRGLAIAGADLLEIGFGSGSFLAWARKNGAHHIAGTEVNAVMLKAARDFGVELMPENIETVADLHRERFDTIVAFDVFEHLDTEQICAKLRACETSLKVGGHLVLRFPNGQSPFGLVCQNGDPTHKVALSRLVIERLMYGTSLSVIRYRPAYRIRGGNPARALVRIIRYGTRSLITAILNFVYGQSIPWDAVVTIVLQKSKKSTS